MMKKYLLLLMVFMLLASPSYGADTKVSAMTDITSPVVGDDMYVVDDPDGTPLTRKINIGALLDVMSGDVASSSGVTTIQANTVDFTEIKQDNTLAGNPSLLVDECFPIATATGGGFICEGSTADTSEQIYQFPDVNGSDTTSFISVDDKEVTDLEGTALSITTGTLNVTEVDPTVDTESEIEAITGALFGSSKAVTGGFIWVADGTDYEGVAMSGDIAIATGGATTIQANAVDSSMMNTIVESVYWPAGSISADGTQCADATQAVINSGPELYTIICTDNDASQMEGSVVMPDSWDLGTVTFELIYLQTASDTSALEWDIDVQARGAAETVNNTFGTPVNVIDAGVTGSNAVDNTTSGTVTADCTTSCVGGDTLFWRIELDASGTTTAVATLHFLGVKMEYTSNVGD